MTHCETSEVSNGSPKRLYVGKLAALMTVVQAFPAFGTSSGLLKV